jgi:hypothetical protein
MTEFVVHTTTGFWANPVKRIYQVRAIDSVSAADTIRSLWYKSGKTDTMYVGEIVRTPAVSLFN